MFYHGYIYIYTVLLQYVILILHQPNQQEKFMNHVLSRNKESALGFSSTSSNLVYNSDRFIDGLSYWRRPYWIIRNAV